MKYRAEDVLQAALKTYQSVSDDKRYCMSKASRLTCDAARNDGYSIDELNRRIVILTIRYSRSSF